MIKKIILSSLLFILFFIIFMIVNLPASWVYKQFIKPEIINLPIQVKLPAGTIWKGHSSIATKPNIPIIAYVPHINWSLEYKRLLSLKIVYKIELNQVQVAGKKLGNYFSYVGVDLNGIIFQLQDNQAALSIKAIGDFSKKPSRIIGKVTVKKDDHELQNLLNTIPKIRRDGSFSIPVNL